MNSEGTPMYYIAKLGNSDTYYLRSTAGDKIEITRKHPEWPIVDEWYRQMLSQPPLTGSYGEFYFDGRETMPMYDGNDTPDSHKHMGATE